MQSTAVSARFIYVRPDLGTRIVFETGFGAVVGLCYSIKTIAACMSGLLVVEFPISIRIHTKRCV
jgi:hypothetical protein